VSQRAVWGAHAGGPPGRDVSRALDFLGVAPAIHTALYAGRDGRKIQRGLRRRRAVGAVGLGFSPLLGRNAWPLRRRSGQNFFHSVN